MKMDGVEEEDMEKEHFRRRFMLSRQSQTSPHEKLEVTDSRADMLWKLFDMNATPTVMAEFGLGFGMYFDKIRAVGILVCCLCILSIVNFINSTGYSSSGFMFACDKVKLVCLDPGCAYVAKHKTCDLTSMMAIIDVLSALLIMLYVAVDQSRRPKIASAFAYACGSPDPTFGDVVKEDGAKVESYSIMVTDPPKDADDQDAWKDYFDSNFGEVIYVTIARRNRPLHKLLLQRRRLLQNLHLNGSSMTKKVPVLNKKGFKNKNSRFERDAYWMTGAHVKQSYVLNQEEAILRRSMIPQNCGCCSFLASLLCWPDNVEDIEWVAARQEEQELLLHDINDTLAAVVATKAKQRQFDDADNDSYDAEADDLAPIEVDEHYYETADRNHLAHHLVHNGADDVVAVIITFNVAGSATSVLNSSIGPKKPPNCWRRFTRGCKQFWRMICCCCNCKPKGYAPVVNTDLEFREGYVPRCVRPPPPERVRWWALGAAGVDRSHYDRENSQDADYYLFKRRFMTVFFTLMLNLVVLCLAMMFVRGWETPILCNFFLIGVHYNAPMFMKALTEFEYHADSAYHDVWYFQKLTLFRVINLVLIPYYAWRESDRFTVDHVYSSQTLLFLHAVIPPGIKYALSMYKWRYGGLWGCLQCGKEAPEVFDSTNTREFDENGGPRSRRSSSSYNPLIAENADEHREMSSSRAMKAVGLRRLAAMLDVEPDLADRYSHLVATIAMALSMSAFVVTAPLFLLVALVTTYYADKFEMIRMLNSGWVRGLNAFGHYKIASHATLWIVISLLIHFAITANGYAGWPHDGLCPTWAEDVEGAKPGKESKFWRERNYVHPDEEERVQRAHAYPTSMRRYGDHVHASKMYHACRTEGGDPLFRFYILPNIFPRRGDPEVLTGHRRDILFFYTLATFCITVGFVMLYWFASWCPCCRDERKRLAKYSERKVNQYTRAPKGKRGSLAKKKVPTSYAGDHEDGEIPHFVNLGASVEAYIPLTDRGYNSRLSPFDLYMIQPSSPDYPRRRVIRGLGDFIHFPLIACQDGRKHFIPHHLPWRHPPPDLQPKDGINNTKLGVGLASGVGSKSLIEKLLLFRPGEFPHLPVAAGLLDFEDMSQLLKSNRKDFSVDIMKLLKKSKLFSSIHLFGDYYEADEEEEDYIEEEEEEEEAEAIIAIADQGKIEKRKSKGEAALRDKALKERSEKERLLIEKEEREIAAKEKALRDKEARARRAQEKEEKEEEARKLREKKAAQRAEEEEEARKLREKKAAQRAEEEEEERRLREREAEARRAEEEAEADRLAAEKRDRDAKAAAKKLEAERLAAEEAAAADFMASAAENAARIKEEAEERKRRLREAKAAREEEDARQAEERERQKLEEREAAKRRHSEAAKLRALRKQKVVKVMSKSAVPPRDLGGNLRARINSVRLDIIKGLAEHREPLSVDEMRNIESADNLVYMWPLEDGDKLTEEVKPWPCTVSNAATVKLTMPKPCGRSFDENEKAWSLVFSSFLNTPGTPFRSHLKFSPDGKLTSGTGYMASVLDAKVIRVPKGELKSFVDVEYMADTNGKEPRAGDKVAQKQLTELNVPVARISSREEYQRIFVGAMVRVTKIVQRTFEFQDGAAAHDAMTTMLKNTPKEKKSLKDEALGAIGEDEGWENEEDEEEEAKDLDARFGLIHGNCRFTVTRPLKVILDGLEEHTMTLPSSDSVRIAGEDDAAPEEEPFPQTSRWGDGVDPATQTVWDPKALAIEGMPLRFINNRKHCSVVYKICSLIDIDKPEALAVTAADIKGDVLSRTTSELNEADEGGPGVGAKFGISARNSIGDIEVKLPKKEIDKAMAGAYHQTRREYHHEPIVVYIRPGETAWVKSPPGVYHLRLCEGRKWFGDVFKFGPSAITMDDGKPKVPGKPPVEPFANYGMSKWRYPTLWLYKSRVGRWLVTPEDPTVVLTPYGDEEPETEEEEEKLRDLYIRDVGLFRTKDKDVTWPHVDPKNPDAYKGKWEIHKGSTCALADSDEEDDYDDNGGKSEANSKAWAPFAGLKVEIDEEAFTVAGKKKKKGNEIDPVAGPAGFILQGLPLLVEDKGAFLRVAKKDRSERNARMSMGGLTSLARPLRIHDSPVFRFDPRYQFLRGLYSSPLLDSFKKTKLGSFDEDAEENEYAGAGAGTGGDYDYDDDDRGKAGPGEGAWWLQLRDAAKDAGTFAREVLHDLDEEGGEISDFFTTWSAATFEVPEKRIRTVLWPQN